MTDLEAVQFQQWGRWHAVSPVDDNRTLCGRNAVQAKRMWERWSEHEDRCRRCAATAARMQRGEVTEA